METQRIILASGNKGKLKELNAMLAGTNLADDHISVVAQSEFDLETPEETGLTFVENAILKARYVAEQTGLPAIADDSGLEVDAMHGEPGIYSARYAGEDATDQENLNKLLLNMQDVPDEKRQCRFHCVIVYLRFPTDPTPLISHGIWEGSLLRESVGENGFGYDPIFYVAEHNCSSAQLSPELKNQISHRGQALQELVKTINV